MTARGEPAVAALAGAGLAGESCVACRADAVRLGPDEVEALLFRLPRWTPGEDGRVIFRRYAFGDFAGAFGFVSTVAAIAEEQGHHPDLRFGWGYVEVDLQTHSIVGLHRNDFIVAARIEQAFAATTHQETGS